MIMPIGPTDPMPAADEPGSEAPLRPEHYASTPNLIEHAPLRPLPGEGVPGEHPTTDEPDEPELPDDEPEPGPGEPERPVPYAPELPAAAADRAGWPAPPRRARSGRVRLRLTKRTRRDLDRRLTAMCQPAGWRPTLLNPDLDPRHKMTILASRFGMVAAESHPEALYSDLLDVAAGAAAWAQSIQRRYWREQKRAQRARKRRKRKGKRR